MSRFSLLLFISTLLCYNTVQAQMEAIQKYNLYQFNWAGISGEGDCNASINLTRISIELRDLFLDKHVLGGQFFYRTGDLHNFFTDFEQPMNLAERSILPFMVCYQQVIHIKFFIYDHKRKKLVNEFGYASPSDSVMITLENALFEIASEAKKTKEEIHSTRFEECILPYRMDYFYNIFRDEEIKRSQEIFEPSKQRLDKDNILNSLQHYLTTLNYDYIEIVREIKDKNKRHRTRMTKKLRKLEEDYPNLFDLLEFIVVFEDYKKGTLEKQQSLESHLNISIKRLKNKNKPFTEKEKRYYLSKFDHDSLSTILTRSANLIINCRDVFQVALEEEEKGNLIQAQSVYFEILSNQNINSLLSDVTGLKKDCSALKKDAWEKYLRISKKRRDLYLKSLTIADTYRNDGRCDKAVLYYHMADSFSTGLSYYAKARIEECSIFASEDSLETRIHYYYDVRKGLTAIMGSKFNVPIIGELVDKRLSGENLKEGVSFFIETDITKSSSWLTQNNYRNGEFIPTPSELDDRLIEGIMESYERYKGFIKKIKISYQGSSDATKFRNGRSMKLMDTPAGVLNNIVIECGYDEERSYNFRDLLDGEAENIRGDRVKRWRNWKRANHLKNLALAHLRAVYRKEYIQKSLSTNIPTSLIEDEICATVSQRTGPEHRFVNIKVTFYFNLE